MTPPPHCAVHPGQPADGVCARCRNAFCSECLRPWDGRHLCPACRRVRIRKRLLVAGIVTVMVGVPAAIVAWSVWDRLQPPRPSARHTSPARNRQRAAVQRARLRRAEALRRAGRIRRAQAQLQQILAQDPRHLGALHLLARIARTQQRPNEVLRLTSRILLHAPASADARLWQAEAYGRLELPGKAEATLRTGLTAAPRSARIALALSDLLVAQKRVREAVLLLRRVLKAGPEGPAAPLRARLKALEGHLP